MSDYKPFDQESDPGWNREPGKVLIPDSNYAKELSKFEQFPSHYTGTAGPGNPYRYRPYPKMLYRAERYKGQVICMASVPDPWAFRDEREYERARDEAEAVTRRCQRVVNDDSERSRAMEEGWRESPEEATAFLIKRDLDYSTANAHRAYEDRNMSEAAKREIAEAVQAVGGEPVPEIKEKPRRGRPRKNPIPPAA